MTIPTRDCFKEKNLFVKTVITPLLKSIGFNKQNNNFIRNTGELIQLLKIEQVYGNKSGNKLSFLLNMALIVPDIYEEIFEKKLPEIPPEYESSIRTRLTWLTNTYDPPFSNPTGYNLNEDVDYNILCSKVEKDMKEVAIPWFEKYITLNSLMEIFEMEKQSTKFPYYTTYPYDIVKFLCYIRADMREEATAILNKKCSEINASQVYIYEPYAKRYKIELHKRPLPPDASDAVKIGVSIFENSKDDICKSILENNVTLKNQLISDFSHKNVSYCIMDCIGSLAYQAHGKDWKLAIGLYEMALDIETPEPNTNNLQLFSNTLWILQNDNTALPVNKKLNEKFLNKCLPLAPQKPDIYFNAACLYVEMNEFDKALECVKLATEYKYANLKGMLNSIMNEKMFSEFRKDKEFIKWYNSFQS